MARSSPIGLFVANNSLPRMQASLAPGVLAATARQRDALLRMVRSYEHVITGYMRANTVAEAIGSRGGVITTAIQSRAPYSAAEEYGTRYRAGHYRITQAVAAYAPRYREGMAAAVNAALASAAGAGGP